MTSEIKQAFNQSGFIILRNLFSLPEVSKLLNFYENSDEIQKHAYGRDDGLNKKTKVLRTLVITILTMNMCPWRFACGTMLVMI